MWLRVRADIIGHARINMSVNLSHAWFYNGRFTPRALYRAILARVSGLKYAAVCFASRTYSCLTIYSCLTLKTVGKCRSCMVSFSFSRATRTFAQSQLRAELVEVSQVDAQVDAHARRHVMVRRPLARSSTYNHA